MTMIVHSTSKCNRC